MAKKQIQKRKKSGFRLILVGILAVLVVAVLVILAVTVGFGDRSGKPESEPQPLKQTSATAEAATEETALSNFAVGFLDATAYGDAVLEKTADAGSEYVKNTLFVGDSNTVRYWLYGATELSNNIGVAGMGVGAISSLPCIEFSGYSELVALPQAIKIIQPQRVLFGFGTNNLNSAVSGTEDFIGAYESAVKTCHKSYPYFEIIINSVPPLNEARSNTSLKQSQVDEFNKALAQMCMDNGWKFLNSAEVLKDSETGWAADGMVLEDGVHLSEPGVMAVFDYFRTHASSAEDERPKPLNSVPTHAKTSDFLIADPLAVEDEQGSVEIPVEFKVEGGGWIDGQTQQKVAKGSACTQVWAKANEGWVFDHWEFSLGGPNSGQEAITLQIPEEIGANGVIATAYFYEAGSPQAEEAELWPDIWGGTDASQYCGYCGHAGHSYDNCPTRQADEG